MVLFAGKKHPELSEAENINISSQYKKRSYREEMRMKVKREVVFSFITNLARISKKRKVTSTNEHLPLGAPFFFFFFKN